LPEQSDQQLTKETASKVEAAVTLDQVNTFKPKLKSVIGLQVKCYGPMTNYGIQPSRLRTITHRAAPQVRR
jgi:hypothetical protein